MQKGIIPSFPRLDRQGNPTGETIPGVDPVFTWDNWSPRIGFAYNAGEQRRRSFAARSASTTTAMSAATGTRRRPFPPTLDGLRFDQWAGRPVRHPLVGLQRRRQQRRSEPGGAAGRPSTRSASEQQFKDDYSFGMLGVYKDTSNQIGWEFLDDGVYETDPVHRPVQRPAYTLLGSRSCSRPSARATSPATRRLASSTTTGASTTGGGLDLQPAIRRLVGDAGVLHLLGVDRHSTRGRCRSGRTTRSTARRRARIRTSTSTSTSQPAGRPTAPAAGAGQLASCPGTLRVNDGDQSAERATLLPPDPRRRTAPIASRQNYFVADTVPPSVPEPGRRQYRQGLRARRPRAS